MKTFLFFIPFYGLFKCLNTDGHWLTGEGFALVALYNISLISGLLLLALRYFLV